MEEFCDRLSSPGPISWSTFDLVNRSRRVASWIKAAGDVLVNLGANYGGGVAGLIETTLALLSRSHEVGATGVQLRNVLPLHFYLFEDAIIWSLCNLWKESRGWVWRCASEWVGVCLVITLPAVRARDNTVLWEGLKRFRNVRGTRLWVFDMRDLHFILRSEFILVLKLWILWRHCKYLVSIGRSCFLWNDLNIDLVIEIEFSVNAVFYSDAQLGSVARTCGGDAGTDPDVLTGLR